MASISDSTTQRPRHHARPQEPSRSAIDPSPHSRPGALAVTAFTLGVLAVVLGLSLIWIPVAIPVGLAAIACSLVERRRARRDERRMATIAVAGLVLGVASMLLSFGALVVLPRVQGYLKDTVAGANTVVESDLDSLEESTTKNINDLDDTLSSNVDKSTKSLSDDFDQLESDTSAALGNAEDRLKAIISQLETDASGDISDLETRLGAIISQLEQDTKSDAEALEDSISQDIADERTVARNAEARLRSDLNAGLAEIERLRALVE